MVVQSDAFAYLPKYFEEWHLRAERDQSVYQYESLINNYSNDEDNDNND